MPYQTRVVYCLENILSRKHIVYCLENIQSPGLSEIICHCMVKLHHSHYHPNFQLTNHMDIPRYFLLHSLSCTLRSWRILATHFPIACTPSLIARCRGRPCSRTFYFHYRNMVSSSLENIPSPERTLCTGCFYHRHRAYHRDMP